MKLKRFVSSFLTIVMILGMTTVVPTTIATTPVGAASNLLSAAKKNGTAKTPTAAQQAQIDQKFAGVVCWGDSLTAGTGYGGAAYPYRLGEYIASNLIAGFNSFTKRINYGVGGEAAQSICARANVVPATLKNAVTIPASGSVSISINVSVFGQTAGGSNYAGLQGVDGPSTAVINGVAGTLSGRGYNLTFTRSTAGSAVQCNAGTAVTFSCGNLYDNKNYIPIVYMGYNNGADWCNTNFSTYSSYIDKIINKYPMGRAGRYVVVCPHFALDKVSVCKQVEAQMEAKYGSHLIKTREFIVTNGFAATGLTPTAADNTRLAAGQIPPTFLAVDNTHFNNAGSDLITRMIYQKLYDLGYFNEVISILGINLTPGTGGGGDTPTHTHTPGAAATCTTPQKCTSCQQVIVAALGHNYVNGKCTRCSADDPSVAAAYTTSVNEGCNTGLSQKYNFDLYSGGSGYGIGNMSFAQCVTRSQVATAATAKKVEASAIGAYMTRGVLLDSNASNSGMSWLATAANGSERVYANGVINGDAPYVVYKVKAPSGTIDTVNVKVNAGNLNKLRGAVYVTDNLGYNNSTGSLNFSSFKFLGSFEGSNFTGFYPEAEAKSFTLASGQISGKSELYVVIALSNFAEAAGDAERLSGINTTNARITAIQIEATASGSTPTHTHTPGAAASCTTPQICTSCTQVLVAALGHNYVSGKCTRCGATQGGGQPDQPTGKVLSIAQHYDLYSYEGNFDTGSNDDGTYGIGCLTVKPSITRNDVSASASSKSVSASTVGAYAIHNMFLDCSNANNQAMSYLGTAPTGSEVINASGDVSGDASYVAYKISSGDATSYINSLTVDINSGHLFKFRYSVFVTDSLKYKSQSSDEMDFSSYTKIGNISCQSYDTFYNPYGESDGAKRYTLSSSQLSAIGNKSELYVVIATNSYRSSGAGCLSGTDTGDSRITAVTINATASEPSTPVHTHSMQHTAAVAATCKDAGNIEYWYCTGCQKYFSDVSGNNEITQQATVIAKSTVHSFGQTYLSDATTHWQVCSVCEATSTPASHIPNVDQPTTTTAKICTICKYEIAPIISHTHSMQHTVAVAATCKAAGNIEYWYCTGCQKYFSDVSGNNEITQQATVIAKSTVHSFGQTYSSDASTHWQTCSVCGTTSTPASHIPNVDQPTTTTAKYCVICKYEIAPIIGEVMTGDVSGDNVVTMADVAALKKAIDEKTTASLNQNCDFNNDSNIDFEDVLYLLDYSLRPDLFPIIR